MNGGANVIQRKSCEMKSFLNKSAKETKKLI